jgi:trimeric autotransporter adhesin
MATNNIINSPLPTSLAHGGTNANLTASNGGILYSTASAGAILAGTSTASQSLLSGASTTPAWSTATYPSTTTSNQLLYSSATNVIGGITAANSARLVTNSSGIPSWSSSMTNGQVIIGSTSGTPTAATLTAGTGISITNGAGSITISSGMGGNWVWISTQTASSSTSLSFSNLFTSSYVAYRLVLVNLLPSTTSTQLELQFGTGSGSYVTTATYIYQLFQVAANGGQLDYNNATTATSVQLTNVGSGINPSTTYGGVCGNIDLFVTSGSSHVANGVARLSYENGSGGSTHYVNALDTFQLPAANYTSVKILISSGNMTSGSIYLYGLTT